MPDSPRKRWVVPPGVPHPPEWAGVRRELAIPAILLDTLWHRGLRTPTDVERFLKPRLEDLHDPTLLTDCERAVDRIRLGLDREETFFVFGDYDVDGITAAALWTRVLRHFGAQVECMVPNRMEDGYGLTPRSVERAVRAGASILISNDCGTTAHEAVTYAQERGIDVIVIDHHMPEATLPPAFALVNPRRPGDRYPFRDLAAVGVAFKVLQRFVERFGSELDRNFLLGLLDLVAIGCVADVVPLRGENRIFSHFGMRVLRHRRRPAMQALVEQAGLADKHLESSHIAFSIAPRLNAAGRLGHPELALALLLAENLEEARALAARLESDNDQRRRLHEVVLAEALHAMAEEGDAHPNRAIVLGQSNWHPGVLGIAASRLVERFRVPVILVSLDGEVARGSGRTPAGYDLLAIVRAAASSLSTFGGHRQAVGLSMKPSSFGEFQALLRAQSEVLLAGESVEATLELDGALEPAQCDLDLVRWMERLGPFGEGNAEPLFFGHAFCRPGRVLQERHLRLEILSGGRPLDCIGFGLGGWHEEIPAGGVELKLAYTPTLNRFRGQEKVQLKLREIDFV